MLSYIFHVDSTLMSQVLKNSFFLDLVSEQVLVLGERASTPNVEHSDLAVSQFYLCGEGRLIIQSLSYETSAELD